MSIFTYILLSFFKNIFSYIPGPFIGLHPPPQKKKIHAKLWFFVVYLNLIQFLSFIECTWKIIVSFCSEHFKLIWTNVRPRNSISVVYGDAKLCVTYRQENGLICCKRKMNLWFKLCYCKEIIIKDEFHSLCKCWYWHFNIELKNYVF